MLEIFGFGAKLKASTDHIWYVVHGRHRVYSLKVETTKLSVCDIDEHIFVGKIEWHGTLYDKNTRGFVKLNPGQKSRRIPPSCLSTTRRNDIVVLEGIEKSI